MNALADKVQNQEVPCMHTVICTPCITLAHYSTTIPTKKAGNLVPTAMPMQGWLLNNAWILVFVLCQPVHSFIEPSLHGPDFFLEIFLWRLVSVLFDKNLLKICYTVPPMCCG